MSLRLTEATALLLAIAACSAEPAPPSLPVFADLSMERECACVTSGECPVADAFEGQSETRDFQCRWADQAGGRAVCAYESRSKDMEPGSQWSPWSRTTVALRHVGARGWCWSDRLSEDYLSITATSAGPYPPAVRQPTQAEAERVADQCGTRAQRARINADLLRLAPWALYEPVERAADGQKVCLCREIRRLLAGSAAT